jgi:hypothetical protein
VSKAERPTPNPRYEQLKQLLNRLQKDANQLRTPYRDALKRMSHKIWIGPAARKWTSEVEFYDEQMRTLVSRMIADVEDALRNTPEQLGPKSQ